MLAWARLHCGEQLDSKKREHILLASPGTWDLLCGVPEVLLTAPWPLHQAFQAYTPMSPSKDRHPEILRIGRCCREKAESSSSCLLLAAVTGWVTLIGIRARSNPIVVKRLRFSGGKGSQPHCSGLNGCKYRNVPIVSYTSDTPQHDIGRYLGL